jgi:hypothetical protein
MKNVRFIITAILFLCVIFGGMAQEVQLNGKDRNNRESVSVKLYDNNEGHFLLDLPLTFHITSNNILFMIIGSDNGISGSNAVWMFDRDMSLADFLKRNKGVTTSKSFSKQLKRIESFYNQSDNVDRYTYFDNGFDFVQGTPKPVFFKVNDPTKPIVLKLKFYTSAENNNRSQVLSSEAGAVKVTINITK